MQPASNLRSVNVHAKLFRLCRLFGVTESVMKKNEKEIQDLIDLLPSQGLKSYVLRNYGFLYQVKVFD